LYTYIYFTNSKQNIQYNKEMSFTKAGNQKGKCPSCKSLKRYVTKQQKDNKQTNKHKNVITSCELRIAQM